MISKTEIKNKIAVTVLRLLGYNPYVEVQTPGWSAHYRWMYFVVPAGQRETMDEWTARVLTKAEIPIEIIPSD